MNSPDPISKERPKMAALEAAAALPGPDPVASVSYHSAGKTLIIGSSADVAPWAEGLYAQLELTALLTDAAPPLGAEPARLYAAERARDVRLQGWLGAFEATWQQGGLARTGRFDLVLDLSPAPLLAQHEKPAGYFAPGADVAARAAAVQQLAEMIGEFEKPKYFSYKERLCAHSRNR
ncbi:MAG: hypothetical protein QFF03_18210, partial [Pseudomonadota bacterium]|nr:hypothetical protein [Pseudomonadota bacterium]